MKAIALEQWEEYFLNWAGLPANRWGEYPPRLSLQIQGELPNGRDGGIEIFDVAHSRDVYGTVVHLAPSQVIGLLSDQDLKKAERKRERWNQWWAKIAVRSGYMQPTVDPTAFSKLSFHRLNDDRLEFIVDTNVLISGVGHWLVRWFGDVADLVRTVVTDLEIQRFAEGAEWSPKGFDGLSTRTCFLASSRFLEFVRHKHPIWRRLDIAEETALFVAKTTDKSGKKEAGIDTLLLRAARRSIQEQVPGLSRYFVTGDWPLARSALHDLPEGSTIAAYVNPLPEGGSYLDSLHWWPGGHENGQGHHSCLAHLIYESTCICDAVRIVHPDGRTLRLMAFKPGNNQFPSDWANPSIWVDEPAAASEVCVRDATKIAGGVAEPRVPEVFPEPHTSVSRTAGISISPEEMEAQGSQITKEELSSTSDTAERKVATIHQPIIWPLRQSELLRPRSCQARAPGPLVLDALFQIQRGIAQALAGLRGSQGTLRELRTFLNSAGLLSPDDKMRRMIGEAFKSNNLDIISEMLTASSSYHLLIQHLRRRRQLAVGEAIEGIPGRTIGSMLGIARLLGQAVLNEGEVYFGGEFVSAKSFASWLDSEIESKSADNPLGEVPIASIARKALKSKGLSPVRFGRALKSVLEQPMLGSYVTNAGGTPEPILEEEIAELSSAGWKLRVVSADGLLGYRTIKRRVV